MSFTANLDKLTAALIGWKSGQQKMKSMEKKKKCKIQKKNLSHMEPDENI